MKWALTLMIILAGAFALWPSTASAALPGKNGPIAFTAVHDLGGQCQAGYYRLQAAADEGIFTMDPDGSAASQVSSQHRPLVCYSDTDSVYPDPDYRFDEDPSFSPSGKRFVFTKAFYTNDCNGCYYEELDFYPSVAVMNVDGSNRQGLGRGGYDPSFSPSGKKIVFVLRVWVGGIDRGGYINKVAVMSSRGRHPRILIGHGEYGSAEEGSAPAFFPTGARIAYVSSYQPGRKGPRIATIRLDGSHQRWLTKGSASSLDVSPNGRRIVLGRRTGIYVMRSDGTHEHRLADGSDPVFSPNGKLIAFARDNTIFVMTANGSHEHAVIPSPLPFGVADPSQLALGQPSWGPRP